MGFPFKARVMRSHSATDPRELPIQNGNIIQILACDKASGWWKAQDNEGNRGWVPASYVTAIEEVPEVEESMPQKVEAKEEKILAPSHKKKLSLKEKLLCGGSAQKTQLFGISLDQIKANIDRAVPLSIMACIEDVRTRGIHEEGILRISGSKADINTAKGLMEIDDYEFAQDIKAAQDGTCRFQAMRDPHNVGGLLREFLMNLPHGILGTDGSNMLTTFTQREMMNATLKTNGSVEEVEQATIEAKTLHTEFTRIVSSLSPNIEALFIPLFRMCRDVVDNESVTKMTPLALSRIIGPSLMDMSDPSLTMSAINSGTQCAQQLIDKWDILTRGSEATVIVNAQERVGKLNEAEGVVKVRRVRDVRKCPVFRTVCAYTAHNPKKEISVTKNELLYRVDSKSSRGWCKVAKISAPHVVRYIPLSYLEEVEQQS